MIKTLHDICSWFIVNSYVINYILYLVVKVIGYGMVWQDLESVSIWRILPVFSFQLRRKDGLTTSFLLVIPWKHNILVLYITGYIAKVVFKYKWRKYVNFVRVLWSHNWVLIPRKTSGEFCLQTHSNISQFMQNKDKIVFQSAQLRRWHSIVIYLIGFLCIFVWLPHRRSPASAWVRIPMSWCAHRFQYTCKTWSKWWGRKALCTAHPKDYACVLIVLYFIVFRSHASDGLCDPFIHIR